VIFFISLTHAININPDHRHHVTKHKKEVTNISSCNESKTGINNHVRSD